MSLNRSNFTSYQLCDSGMVLMSNNSICKVIGFKKVGLKMYDGMVRELTQVRHVLELKRNLISISILDQMGYTIKAEKRVLRVIKDLMEIMKGIKLNDLYMLSEQIAVGEASVTEYNKDRLKLWNLRLKHMSEV